MRYAAGRQEIMVDTRENTHDHIDILRTSAHGGSWDLLKMLMLDAPGPAPVYDRV